MVIEILNERVRRFHEQCVRRSDMRCIRWMCIQMSIVQLRLLDGW
jgi:hypothetical protein